MQPSTTSLTHVQDEGSKSTTQPLSSAGEIQHGDEPSVLPASTNSGKRIEKTWKTERSALRPASCGRMSSLSLLCFVAASKNTRAIRAFCRSSKPMTTIAKVSRPASILDSACFDLGLWTVELNSVANPHVPAASRFFSNRIKGFRWDAEFRSRSSNEGHFHCYTLFQCPMF